MAPKRDATEEKKKVTAKFVQDVIDGKIKKAGDYHDRDGLYLRVKKTGTGSWLYRFMLHGCPRKMGLGPADAIGLAEARNKHYEARNLVKNGTDPIKARKKKQKDERDAATKQITLAQAREGWLKIQNWNPGTGSTAYREFWLWALYGEPKEESRKYKRRPGLYLGSYTLSELADGNLIVKAFTEIIGIKRYKKSAKYALQHHSSIIEWAKNEELFSGDNPVNLRKRPQKSRFLRRLPSLEYETTHRRAMPWPEIPEFIARLRAQKGNCGRFALDERSLASEAIELQILTGGRPLQAILAQWDEFDLDAQIWKVPLHTTVNGRRYYRRKRKDLFTIYINRPAVRLLRDIKKRQEKKEGGLRKFVFSWGPALTASKDYHPSFAWQRKETSRYGDSDFRYGGMPITRRGVHDYFTTTMGVKDYDLYGFRGSFKQWQVAHGYNELAGEAVLDHQVGDSVRNVYAQGAVPLVTIEVLDFWGAHCDGKNVSKAMTANRTPQEEKA
jgi:integrase